MDADCQQSVMATPEQQSASNQEDVTTNQLANAERGRGGRSELCNRDGKLTAQPINSLMLTACGGLTEVNKYTAHLMPSIFEEMNARG
jgi:hypothetical protein